MCRPLALVCCQVLHLLSSLLFPSSPSPSLPSFPSLPLSPPFISKLTPSSLLLFFLISCEIFDFHCHCCTKNISTPNYTPSHLTKNLDHTHSHSSLMEWVYKYFSQNDTSHVSLNGPAKSQKGNLSAFIGKSEKIPPMPCAPLYFQHQGISPLLSPSLLLLFSVLTFLIRPLANHNWNRETQNGKVLRGGVGSECA